MQRQEKKNQNKLHSISRAPLKPNKKMYTHRSHLIPSLAHFITFNSISLKSLSASNTKIRSAGRQWLYLPKDIHEKYEDKDIHIQMTNTSPDEFPPPKVYVTAFVYNCRGVISSKSYSSWCSLFSRSTSI